MEHPELPNHVLWGLLERDPSAALSVISVPEGQIVWMNRRACRVFFDEKTDPKEVVGETISHLFPMQMVRERRKIFRRVVASGEPAIVRSIWRGVQTISLVFPVADGEHDRIVAVTRQQSGQPLTEDGLPMIYTDTIDLGELSALHPREIVVLAMLGERMRPDEIAEHLHTSPHTVRAQVRSIKNKLKARSNLDLAGIAYHAGLSPTDAERVNVNGD